MKKVYDPQNILTCVARRPTGCRLTSAAATSASAGTRPTPATPVRPPLLPSPLISQATRECAHPQSASTICEFPPPSPSPAVHSIEPTLPRQTSFSAGPAAHGEPGVSDARRQSLWRNCEASRFCAVSSSLVVLDSSADTMRHLARPPGSQITIADRARQRSLQPVHAFSLTI